MLSNIKCGSDAWIPGIRGLCNDFLCFLKTRPGGQYIKFRDELGTIEKPGKMSKEYHKTVHPIKKEIFGDSKSKELIDYHKIAALYIRSFLKHKPFYLDIPKKSKDIEVCLYTEFPNEYFVIAFLEAIFQSWNEDFEGVLAMDQNYQDDLIKLLFHYKEDINRLDPLSFSNTVYLIEHKFFKKSWPEVEFGSDKWLPEINQLCFEFLENLRSRPGGKYLCFKDNLFGIGDKPGKIAIEYHYNVEKYKKEIFKINKDKVNVNYYKIISIYICSFLKYKPFYFDIPNDTKDFKSCLYTELANEYFILALLEAMLKIWNNDFDGILEIEQDYQNDFIKTLFSCKEDIKRFDPLSLSETIFHIEQNYFRCNKTKERV